MNEVVKEACITIFLLAVGLAVCWNRKAFWRASDELDKRLKPSMVECESYGAMVVRKEII